MSEREPTTLSSERVMKNAAGGDAARYEAVLAEARQIQGVSLARDSLRRLLKNRAAVAAGAFLGVLLLLTVLTPLLPLQSPRDIDPESRMFLPPNFNSVRLNLDPAETAAADERIAAARQELTNAPSTKSRDDYSAALRSHPFERLWTRPGWITRSLLSARLRLFGTWCVPSLFGTDSLGRDVLSRTLWGARVSLMVGVLATAVALLIGVTMGAIAGYAGGWTDAGIMRFVDVIDSVPFIFVVILINTILGEDAIKSWLARHNISRLTVMFIIIGCYYWLTMARIVRGQILSLKHEQFVDAARVIGARAGRIVFRHLVPNVLGIVVIYLTLTIPSVMLFEAFLSFLGQGVEPPDVSLGWLVNEGVRVITPLKIFWWLVLFPSATLALTLFALNFLGDGLRDALDPRLKNR